MSAPPSDANSYARLPEGLLAPAQAGTILAIVGDATITLGDFAATLQSMNKYDRLRFATVENREALLDKIIDSALLEQEARRRELHKVPTTAKAIEAALANEELSPTGQKQQATTILVVALRETLPGEDKVTALKSLLKQLRSGHLKEVHKQGLAALGVNGMGELEVPVGKR